MKETELAESLLQSTSDLQQSDAAAIATPADFSQLVYDVLDHIGTFLCENELLLMRGVNRNLNNRLDNEFNKHLLVSLLKRHAMTEDLLLHSPLETIIRYDRWGIYFFRYAAKQAIQIPSLSSLSVPESINSKEKILSFLENQTEETKYPFILTNPILEEIKTGILIYRHNLPFILSTIFLIITMVLSLYSVLSKNFEVALLSVYRLNGDTLAEGTACSLAECANLPLNISNISSSQSELLNSWCQNYYSVSLDTPSLSDMLTTLLDACRLAHSSCTPFYATFNPSVNPLQFYDRPYVTTNNKGVGFECVNGGPSSWEKFLSIYGAVLSPIFLFFIVCTGFCWRINTNDARTHLYLHEGELTYFYGQKKGVKAPENIINRIRSADFFKKQDHKIIAIPTNSAVAGVTRAP